MEFPQNDDPAPADTPLGMLQRGRGAGWLAALDHEEGPQWLLACLARDPRRDGPLEERADYYATLALRLLVSPEAFANGPDLEDESLVYDVIEAMARRGSDVAAALIHSAHRADDEPGECAQDQWSEHRSAVETGASADAPIDIILEASWSCPIPDSLIDRLCTTCDAMEIDALRRAAQDVNGPGWRLALHVLARRGDLSPLDVVEKVLIKNESGLVRAWAFRFVTALKAEVALPLARAWLTHDDGRGSVAAAVLADHAELVDAPALRAALADGIGNDTDLVAALGRLPEAGPFPELDEIFVESASSNTRDFAVGAMAAANPTFAVRWATECLWDSEAGVRADGARLAPLTPMVIDRLQELADDEFEVGKVRDAAWTRLG